MATPGPGLRGRSPTLLVIRSPRSPRSELFSTPDSANFSGGSLHVAFTENGTATDQLKIVTDAIVTLTGAGGTTIKVNGTSIGTWSGGSNGTDLVISFNNASTPAAVETLIKHIGYANSSASPSTLTREVTFTVNDGDGSANGGSNIGLATATISYNHAPTAVAFANTTPIIAENSDTSSHLKVADIVVTDDGLGTNALTLAGADAAAFEIVGNSLYLKAGTALDFEIKSSYSVAVKVDDPSVGSNPDALSRTSRSLSSPERSASFDDTTRFRISGREHSAQHHSRRRGCR